VEFVVQASRVDTQSIFHIFERRGPRTEQPFNITARLRFFRHKNGVEIRWHQFRKIFRGDDQENSRSGGKADRGSTGVVN